MIGASSDAETKSESTVSVKREVRFSKVLFCQQRET